MSEHVGDSMGGGQEGVHKSLELCLYHYYHLLLFVTLLFTNHHHHHCEGS